MTEDVTVTDILTSQTPAPSREFHGGTIRIAYHLLEDLVDIRGCNIQREFEDKDVFAELHKKLLLPANYTIRAMFYAVYLGNVWEVVVESPDLPPVDQWSYPPEITPVYETYHEFGIVEKKYRLKEIKIEDRWHRTYSPDELTLERL